MISRKHWNKSPASSGLFSLSTNYKSGCVAAFTPLFVFSATCAAKKHLVSEKTLNKRFFKDTGVVLAGIECSPKISDFRANGIPVQESVDFFDTLKSPALSGLFTIYKHLIKHVILYVVVFSKLLIVKTNNLKKIFCRFR